MDLEIKKRQETPLLSRVRINATLMYEGMTPSRQDVRKALADKLKVDQQLVVIKHIFTKFGAAQAKVIAHVYETKEVVDTLEHENLLNKHLSKEDQKRIKEEKQKAAQEAAANKQQK